MIDFDEAAKLLDLLEGVHLFQTFSEGIYKDKNVSNKRDSAARVVSSATDSYQSVLDTMTRRGAGTFIQVNNGSKRGAANITNVRAIFLDLDGTPLDGVLDAVASGYPKPHCIVQTSPTRYHVYWIVEDCPLPQFGTTQKLMAVHFGGDQCVINPDRVMRLPGSVNFKYEKPFRVVVKHVARSMPPVSIQALVQFPVDHEPPAAAAAATIMAADSLTDALITGPSSDNEDLKVLGSGDRTHKLIRIAGALVESDQERGLASIMQELRKLAIDRLPEGDTPMSDASWETEIEPGVLRFIERRENAKAEAEFERAEIVEEHGDVAVAWTAAAEPEQLAIKDFAERFIYVSTSRLVYDVTKSPAAEPWTLTAFKDYASIFRNNGKPVVSLWMSQKQYRRSVHSTAYRPYPTSASTKHMMYNRVVKDPGTDELCYNTYAPPILEPIMDTGSTEKIQVFLDHMAYLIPDVTNRNHFIDWWAATVQAPHRRVTWAPLIISLYQGVGKGWMAQLLKRLVGTSNYSMITQNQLEGNNVAFNDFMANTTVVVVDELKAARREDILNRLNSMITEPTLEVNAKYGAKQMEEIYANFICYSNHTDALALTEMDRRYWVHILHQKPLNGAYYDRLWDWLNTDGPDHLLGYLLERNITKFSFGKVPSITHSRAVVIKDNWSELDQILSSAVLANEGPFTGDVTYTTLIASWLEIEAKMTLEQADHRELRTWIKKHGVGLGSARGYGTRQVVYAVRIKEQWTGAKPSAIKAELEKSVQAVFKTN